MLEGAFMSAKFVSTLRLGALALTGLTLAACGGGGGGSSPAVTSVQFQTPPPATLSVSSTATITAVVVGGNAGVTWTATCAAADCGTFNPVSTASGAATIYTPPATAPSPAAVTISATSLNDSTRKATGLTTLTPPTGAALADGTYVIHLNGFDGNGPYYLAGAFTVQGGVITAGEQDFTDPVVGAHDSLVPAQSSLTFAGSNIQVLLATTDANVGASGAVTVRGTKVSATRVLISEFDPSATATGSIDLQTEAAAAQGSYAFGLQGTDTGSGNPLVLGGILAFSGTALTTGGSVFDLNDGPTNGSLILRGEAFASGSVSAADAFGRVIIDLIPSATSTVPEFKLAAYAVGPATLYLIEDQADTLNANLAGVALGQGANAGKFTLANVAGTTYAHGSHGIDSANGALTLAGGFALNADGTVGGRLAFVDGGSHNGNDISGTYTVDPTGRVSLNDVLLSHNALTLTFQLYLDGKGNGIVMGVDSFQTTEGLAFAQTGAQPTSGALAVASQGVLGSGSPWSAIGPVTLAAARFSGFTDYNNDGAPQPAVTLSGSFDTGNGTLQFNGLNAPDFTVTTGWGYYPIDANRLIAIEVDGQALGLLTLEAVAP
jgi:hypothetical protein